MRASITLLVVLLFSAAFAMGQDHPTITAQPNTVFVGADGKFDFIDTRIGRAYRRRVCICFRFQHQAECRGRRGLQCAQEIEQRLRSVWKASSPPSSAGIV